MSDETDAEYQRDIRKIARMSWKAEFFSTIRNATAPAGSVDVYELLSDASGVTIGSVAFSSSPASKALADYVAACCGNPHFVWPITWPGTAKPPASWLGIHFNRAIMRLTTNRPHSIDAREITAAVASIITLYIGQLPKEQRKSQCEALHQIVAETEVYGTKAPDGGTDGQPE